MMKFIRIQENESDAASRTVYYWLVSYFKSSIEEYKAATDTSHRSGTSLDINALWADCMCERPAFR